MARQLVSLGLAAALAALLGAPPSARADEACIAPAKAQTFGACPGSAAKVQLTKRGAVSVGAVAPAPQAGKDATRPRAPDGEAGAPEIRRGKAGNTAGRREPSAVAAIQQLETLLAATPRAAPDRPKLIKRLADEYVELESLAFRRKIESRIGASDLKKKDEKAAQALSVEADKAEKIEAAARQASIRYFSLLETQYPQWCQFPSAQDPQKSQGCGDEVLYSLAYEHEQDKQSEQARKVYLQLVTGFPASRYVPRAYLAFGELFFNEAQGDPSRWSLAEQSYKEVVKYPAPENQVLGYARYKLAYVYWNKGDYAQALSELKKVIEFGAQFPALAGAKQLASSSRRDILPLFALAGDAKKAHDFVRPLSGDVGPATEGTFKMLDELGQAYLDIGNYQSAVTLYRDLMTRDEGPKACLYQAHITEATMALRAGDKPAILVELGRQIEARERARKRGFPAEDLSRCASRTGDLLVETAMAWHLEAEGSGGVRGTGSKETMGLAAKLYDDVLRTFTKEEWARVEFPRVVKEDWPSLRKIRYLRADLLYFQKDWAACGPAFDAVVADDPDGPLAAESAYAALLCYQEVYHASHLNRSDRAGLTAAQRTGPVDLSPRELGPMERAMLAAFDRYLCTITPAPGDKDARERDVEVRYARARIYFENRRWEDAALAFRDVAMNHADSDAGIYAAQLYLESLNVLARSAAPPRTSCYDDMTRDVPKIAELYCVGDAARSHADSCELLAKIQCDLERQGVEALVARADKAGAEASYEKAANAYLDLWNKRGKKQSEAKLGTCTPMDEVLHNAARAFQAARLLAKAISVRKILIDPRYNLDRTALGQQAVFDLGQNYQAIAVYDEAAGYYERYAAESPRGARAPESLEDAVVLRLGLGQEEQAQKDAALFERIYGSRKPALAAQIAFAIGAHEAERGDVALARKRLSAAMPAIDRSAAPDVQIIAHSLLGRVLAQAGDAAAASEFARVRAAYKDPAALVARLRDGGAPDAERRIGKVLSAVGEAEFFFAELRRKEVDRIRFPEYRGSGKRDDVLRHVNTKVADWIKRKKPAIEDAEKAYLTIEALEPAAPPPWMVAAGARVGQMWGRFVAEFRAAPIPKEWMQNGPSPYEGLTWEEIRAAYYESIDRASEPYRQRAKVAYQACLRYSLKYQFFDQHSRSCEAWLSRTYGAEYHLVDELKGAPSWVGTRMEATPALFEAQKP